MHSHRLALGALLAAAALGIALPGIASADGSSSFIYNGSDHETHSVDDPPLDECITLDPPAYGPLRNSTMAQEIHLFTSDDCSGAPFRIASGLDTGTGRTQQKAHSVILRREASATPNPDGPQRDTSQDWGANVLSLFTGKWTA